MSFPSSELFGLSVARIVWDDSPSMQRNVSQLLAESLTRIGHESAVRTKTARQFGCAAGACRHAAHPALQDAFGCDQAVCAAQQPCTRMDRQKVGHRSWALVTNYAGQGLSAGHQICGIHAPVRELRTDAVRGMGDRIHSAQANG
jgi:hypothetical protein